MSATDGTRPKPEDFLRLIQRQNRGKHKIYLGSSAGVGKTYQMLVEGNRLKAKGVDVVIGYVEPHERPETTAQIRELEIIPPRLLEYKGATLREMDVPAILERRPTLVLVDELAHTNAPGSAQEKRYQDVDLLLDAGLNVISTLNVQHLESLYNLVEQATGVKVQERIPDGVLQEADQIVNIDLPAEDLQDRLKAGKIYPTSRAAAALENFFTTENLTRLREIALSESANFLDRQQREAAPQAAVPSALGRVMVAVSSRSPNAEALLRKTARLAMQLNAEWYALYVRTPSESHERMTLETERLLDDTLSMAQRMGGSVVILKEEKVADALIQFVREQGISHVLMGRTQRSKFQQLLGSSLLDRAMQELPGVDLVVV
jgi:two-component system sensor histidine kinase KdpD